MTLNGVMAIFGVISVTSVAFSAHCVKVGEAGRVKGCLLYTSDAADE